MKKNVLIIGLTCLVFFVETSRVLAAEPVRIGYISVLSGPFGVLGKNETNAAKMAVEEYGTILGNKVELLIRDNALRLDLSVERAKELYEKEKVDVIFAVPHGAAAMAVSDQALKNKKLYFASASGATETVARNRYTFKWTSTIYGYAVALGYYGVEHLGKRWYSISHDYISAHEGLKYTQEILKKKGGELLGNDFVSIGTTDFSPFILKAKQAKPDVVLLQMFGRDMINCTKAAVEYGLKKEVKFIVQDLKELDVKEGGIEFFSGTYGAAPWTWSVKIPGAREFAERYYKRYGERPILAAAGNYSAIWQYLEAVKRAGTKETIPVIKALENYTFRDFFANPGHIRAEDHLLVADYFVFKVKKPEEVKTPEDFFEIVTTIPAAEANPDPKYFGRKLGDF